MRGHRRRLAGVVLAAAIVAAIPGVGAAAPQGSAAVTKTVRTKNFFFKAKKITIQKGDSVKWTNPTGVVHTTTRTKGSVTWDRSLDPGESFTRKFNKKGTFTYRCKIHVGQGMKGTVIVV
jgi:plastocyanin